MRSASQSPRHGLGAAPLTCAAAALSWRASLRSPGHKFASQGSLCSFASAAAAADAAADQPCSPRSLSAPHIPTPALLLVPSQVPRARSDALDLAFSSFLSSLTLSKGMANLLSLGLLFSAGSSAISAATTGGGLRGLCAAFLPWLLGTLLCPEAARDAAVLAALLAVCLALAWGSYASMAAFAARCAGAGGSAAPPASGSGSSGSGSGAPPLSSHSVHVRSLLLRHLLCATSYLVFMVAFLASVTVSPLWACLGLIVAVCILLKIHSWTMTNVAMAREAAAQGGGSGGGWPRNVNAGNFAYFLIAPTLVYESAYPRSPSIRPLFLLCKVLQGLATAVIGFWVLFNSVIPILSTPTPPASLTVLPLNLQAPVAFLMDLTRLAMPSIVLWLCVFVGFFSCALGILAELCRFSDRCFYSAWWDVMSLGDFWTAWNLPIHVWCKRHLLLELQAYMHLRKRGAVVATFFLSAVLHELILSTAFKTVRAYFFVAMCLQLPLIWLSRVAGGGSSLGNTLVWVSLFCGQPVLELLYAREFLLQNGRTGRDLLCLAR